MIDSDDGDFFLFSAPTGLLGILFILVAVSFYIIASYNEDECQARVCVETKVARLIDHECICVEKAK